jgi:acetyl-CoA carboxylase biotin carboxyl carrier protein
MDRKLIKELIDAFAASDVAELEYRSNGETLRLVKRGGVPAPAQSAPPPGAASPAPLSSPKPQAVQHTIVAPLYGIVHLQQAPGVPPFVVPGQTVAAGQVLCVIEAMKVFNQVRAERECVIGAALVQSGQEVEAGQALFELA